MRAAAFVAVAALAASSPPPNVLLVLVDDFGWNDFGPHSASQPNANEIQTPIMDSLVAEGILLDRHYVFSFCSPSRSALHTGRNPIHVNVLNSDLSQVNLADPVAGFAGVPRNMTALPAKLSAAGYHTIQSGKWHVGCATPDHTPHGRGYAQSLTYLDGANDYWNHVTGDWCKNGEYTDLYASLGPAYTEVNAPNCSQKNQPASCRYEDAIFTDFAVAAVQNASASMPLFLYFAPHNCHTPLEVPAAQLAKFAFINDSDSRQYYAAMVNLVDAHIGQVVDAFKAKGLWENTLMIVRRCLARGPLAAHPPHCPPHPPFISLNLSSSFLPHPFSSTRPLPNSTLPPCGACCWPGRFLQTMVGQFTAPRRGAARALALRAPTTFRCEGGSTPILRAACGPMHL
jgi:arylsulfatase B